MLCHGKAGYFLTGTDLEIQNGASVGGVKSVDAASGDGAGLEIAAAAGTSSEHCESSSENLLPQILANIKQNCADSMPEVSVDIEYLLKHMGCETLTIQKMPRLHDQDRVSLFQ